MTNLHNAVFVLFCFFYSEKLITDCKMGLGTVMSIFGLSCRDWNFTDKDIIWLTSGPKPKKAEEWVMSVHISHSPKMFELCSIIFSEAGRGK